MNCNTNVNMIPQSNVDVRVKVGILKEDFLLKCSILLISNAGIRDKTPKMLVMMMKETNISLLMMMLA